MEKQWVEMNNYQVYLPIRIKNAEKDQDRIFPQIRNIDLQSIQKMVSKPIVVFDLNQSILLQVSPSEVFKVGLDTDWEVLDSLLQNLDLTIPGAIQNGDMVITAFGKAQRQLNQVFINITNLFSTKTTNDLAEGSINLYFTQARARTATIQNLINSSETQRGASQGAIYLALEAVRVALEALIQNETNSRISEIQTQADLLNLETQDRLNAINIIDNQINNLQQLLLDESLLRSQEDTTIRNLFQDEISILNQLIVTIQNEILTIPRSFVELSDTPNSYVGHANKLLSINPTENGVEFIDKPNSFFEIISNNAQFSFTTQNMWFTIPNVSLNIVSTGIYEVEYITYSRSSASNRTYKHRLTLDGVPILNSENTLYARDTTRSFRKYLIVKVTIADLGNLQIQVLRTGGNGSYESWEKYLKVRKINE